MSYVDAFLDRDFDIIKVVERVDGQRVHKEHLQIHVLLSLIRKIYKHPMTNLQGYK